MPGFLAQPYDGILRPDRMLRLIAILGLTGVAGFVLAFHRKPVAFLVLALGALLVVLIDRRVSHENFSQDFQRLFKF
jgi:hypothetical protein